MRISALALLVLTASAQVQQLGTAVADAAKFPSGKDDGSSGASGTNDTADLTPVTPPPEPEEEQPATTTVAGGGSNSCVKDGKYYSTPTPCDGTYTDHLLIVTKENGWAYYYYYQYYGERNERCKNLQYKVNTVYIQD